VRPDEIEQVIKANIDKTVCAAYVEGKTEVLFVHTADDEGFVCDIANEMSRLMRTGPIYRCPCGSRRG
jgi:thiamine phosphate synthase YjbQ (UPF0047 family)